MNLVRGLVLAKELFDTIESFDGQCSKEEAKSKKLSEDLKAMSLEKAQLESDKRALQFKLDSVMAKEADLKRSLEAITAEKDKFLVSAREEVEKVKAERADAEAKAVEAYQDAFVDTPEY
ncbi:hypothetical protein Adt_41880 [Abeliophyllum distichum]|uniref:Uncharacterized protein n=1 Tax=Abeliophyllum distichum TaxID=126358 RepID=A0ABD1PSW7_9LAMI